MGHLVWRVSGIGYMEVLGLLRIVRVVASFRQGELMQQDTERDTAVGEPRVTTVEELAQRPLIEPYSGSPVIEVPAGVIACAFCAHTRFRRSRVRIHDLKELMLLRYPVRCMRCNQRQYASYLTAGISLPPKSHGPRLARGGETWKAWTEQGMDGQKLPRPMSTAMGPRATKLQPEVAPRHRPVPQQAATPQTRDVQTQGWRDEDHQIW